MNDPTKTERFACVFDPSIDTEKTDLNNYSKTRSEADIKAKADCKVTWFHLKPIPAGIYQRLIGTAGTEGERQMFAFMYSVAKVENWVSPDESGKMDLWEPSGSIQVSGGKEKICSDDDLDKFSHEQIQEIGAIALRRSFLGPAAARRRGYRLPPTLAQELEEMTA